MEWKDGDRSETSYSETIFERDYIDIRDVVCVVDEGMKRVSSTEGHATAQSSIAYLERQKRIGEKIEKVKSALKQKDFATLGEMVEREALEFHSILLTSNPPIIAWYPGTIEVMHAVQQMRTEGIMAFFTISTGFNVHVLTLPEYEDEVGRRLYDLPLVKKVLHARVGGKPYETDEHLF